MSDLKEQIFEATKVAMKARDKARVGILRLINADIKRIEVDERRELSDEDVLTILNRMLKQRTDSFTQYTDAGRTDLADQEDYEMGVVREYMPEPLDEAAIAQTIEDAISETGAQSMRDMGKVMGLLKTKLQGRADMGKVSGLIKAQLS